MTELLRSPRRLDSPLACGRWREGWSVLDCGQAEPGGGRGTPSGRRGDGSIAMPLEPVFLASGQPGGRGPCMHLRGRRRVDTGLISIAMRGPGGRCSKGLHACQRRREETGTGRGRLGPAGFPSAWEACRAGRQAVPGGAWAVRAS